MQIKKVTIAQITPMTVYLIEIWSSSVVNTTNQHNVFMKQTNRLKDYGRLIEVKIIQSGDFH